MQKSIPLQINLQSYDEEDWEILWEKLLTHCHIPERIISVESQRAYAYNYANSMIEFLKQKCEEDVGDEV